MTSNKPIRLSSEAHERLAKIKFYQKHKSFEQSIVYLVRMHNLLKKENPELYEKLKFHVN